MLTVRPDPLQDDTLGNYLATYVTFALANIGHNRAAAIAHLQALSNRITSAEIGAWFDALAVAFNAVGWCGAAAFTSMRSKIESSGATVANSFIASQRDEIAALPSSTLVLYALRVYEQATARDDATADIALAQTWRDTPPDPAVLTTQELRSLKRMFTLALAELKTLKQEAQDALQRLGEPAE